MSQAILNKVKDYYSDKIQQYGTTSQGVDWNGEESHLLRFEQLAKLLPVHSAFSLLDYGCGYGALVDFLADSLHTPFDYTGWDISEEMVKEAKKKYPARTFINTLPKEKFDFVLANGIFNVKLNVPTQDWYNYILSTLRTINLLAVKGFSFNLLTSYSDSEHMKDYLYYANPVELFDYCKSEFSRNVALFHDYDLYEFSIIVRK